MLSTKEAAQRLGLKSTGAVRQLILSGTLKAEKFGRDWMVDEQSVEEYRTSDRKRGPKKKEKPVG